ncbi:MAG: porin [Planctomycetota bacterium]
MMSKPIAIAAMTLVAGSALGSETSSLLGAGVEDRNDELLANAASQSEAGKPNPIKMSGEVQFRYAAVFNAQPTAGDDEFTNGFELARTRLKFAGSFDEPGISYTVLGDFLSRSGVFTLADAYFDAPLADGWKVRAGQFKLPFTREFAATGPTKVLAVDRSLADAVFRVGRSQGVQLSWKQDNARASFAINDGRRAPNTSYTSAAESDIALTGRFEYKLGDAGWKQWGDMTSLRTDETGWLFGVAGHWQQDGLTRAPAGYADNSNLYVYTADVGYEGAGYNAMAAFYGQTTVSDDSVTDLGFTVQGGTFVTDNDEIFARYSGVFPDDDRGSSSDSFSNIAVGWNRYLVPDSHALKFTAEVSYSPDTLSDSSDLVSQQTKLGILNDTEDGQFGLLMQMQIDF